MRYGPVLLALASAVGIGVESWRPVHGQTYQETMAQPRRNKQTGVSGGTIAELRARATSQDAASARYREQINGLIEAENFGPIEALAENAIAASTQAIEAIKTALGQAPPDQTAPLYDQLASYYGNLSAVYDLQSRAYSKQNRVEDQLRVQQTNLQVLTAKRAALLASNNEELIINATLEQGITHWYLGQTHQQLEQHLDAIAASTMALEIAQQLSATRLELFTRVSLSQHHWALGEQTRQSGDYGQARAYLTLGKNYAQQVVDLSERPLEQFPRPELVSDVFLINTLEDTAYFRENALNSLWSILVSLGDTQADQQAYAAALENYEQALPVAQGLGKPDLEFNTLNIISVQHQRLADYDRAIAIANQAEAVAKDTNSPALLLRATLWLAKLYDDLGNYPTALARYAEARTLAEAQQEPNTLLAVLNNMGLISTIQGDYPAALGAHNQALEINNNLRRQLTAPDALENLEASCFLWNNVNLNVTERQNQQLAQRARDLCLDSTVDAEQKLLNNIGSVYAERGNYQESLALRERALEIVQTLNDPAGEAGLINNIGNIYQEQGNYALALTSFQAALAIEESIDARASIATSLNNIAIAYDSQGEYALALDYYQRALDLITAIGLKPLEPTTLANIGTLYQSQGNYTQAHEYLQRALTLSQELMFLPSQANQLMNLSNLVRYQGDYDQALDHITQALDIHQRIGQRSREASGIRIRGNIYLSQGEFAAALADQQTALEISRDLKDLDDIAYSLQALGETYESLGQPDQAVAQYQEALQIFKEIGAVTGEASIYNTLGNSAATQGNYAQALGHYRQALEIYQAVGAVGSEALTLTNIGYAQYNLNNLAAANSVFTQALAIQERIGQASEMGATLKGLGLVANQPTEALELLRRSLALYRAQGNRPSEASTLAALGKRLNHQGQPELASVFLKQAVNTYETLRQNLRGLDKNLQVSYTESIADTYRQLADVLLTQGRIPEAQRVLDLLKIEELREFTTRAVWTSDGISLTPLEQRVQATHGSLIALGQAIEECDATRCASRSDLSRQRETLLVEYGQQVQTIEAAYRRECQQVDDQCINPQDLGNEASKLLAAHEDAVLVYPLVVDNKLWLLWAAQNNVVGSIEVKDVTQAQLAQAVADFRQEIGRGGTALASIQAKSRILYDWLIQPLAAELSNNQIKHLIFAHDRYTRYIPMAALHDGEQYLIEQYAVSSILAATETDLDPPPGDPSVLGLGLSDPAPPFRALENVPIELDNIVKENSRDRNGFYAGKVFLNQAFNQDLMRSEVYQHQILHIATHAKFEPGSPDRSFIVLGNGEPLAIPEIDTLLQADLENVHLVVLSACETAYGERGSDGREIAGISSYFLKGNRAQAVMASLWAVNDQSTSLLMQRFYEFLATGTLTKAEALQQAQLSLLYSQDVPTRLGAMRSGIASDWAERPAGAAHPYHWAPFILIGNAL